MYPYIIKLRKGSLSKAIFKEILKSENMEILSEWELLYIDELN
jgi:hypothetical protein